MGTAQNDSRRGLKHEKSRMYDTVPKHRTRLPSRIASKQLLSCRLSNRNWSTKRRADHSQWGPLIPWSAGCPTSWRPHSRDLLPLILMLVAFEAAMFRQYLSPGGSWKAVIEEE